MIFTENNSYQNIIFYDFQESSSGKELKIKRVGGDLTTERIDVEIIGGKN